MATDCYVIGKKLVFIYGTAYIDIYYNREKSQYNEYQSYYDIEVHLCDIKGDIHYDTFYQVRNAYNKNNGQSVVRVYEHNRDMYEKAKPNLVNLGDYKIYKVY